MAKQVLHKKRTLEGLVVSDKMEKTIVVKVEKRILHPVYNKIVKKYKKIKVHDEKKIAKAGDRVRIVESRPYSSQKRFRILQVIK